MVNTASGAAAGARLGHCVAAIRSQSNTGIGRRISRYVISSGTSQPAATLPRIGYSRSHFRSRGSSVLPYRTLEAADADLMWSALCSQ